MVRHLLSDDDLSAEEALRVIASAIELKKRPVQPLLPSKNVALVFSKPSTRTRVSFEVGINQLGGSAVFIKSDDSQISRGEPLSDFARTLSRYVNGIIIRAGPHSQVEEIARHSTVPVINGLTDSFHPCQALADFMTIKEKKGLDGVKLAFFGDGNNNVCRSLIRTASKLGVSMVVACPKQFAPSKDVLKGAPGVKVTDRPKDAAKGADVIYTDVWVSMGSEAEAEARKAALKPFQVNGALMRLAKKDAIFMHCLPAHRGEEVTSEVIDGKQSVVFDQAENRLHVQKAIMVTLMR